MDEPDPLFEAVQALLADGPLPIGELMAQLDPTLYAYLDNVGVPPEELAEAIVDDVILDDSIWATPSNVLALTDPLLEGSVFTHRLTEDEQRSAAVRITPDLTVVDWDLSEDGIPLAGGGRLIVEDGPHVPGENNDTFTGPAGWLAAFSPGDLLGFTRADGHLRVHRVEAPANDDHVVAALRAAAEARIPDGDGEEADAIVLDAMIAEPTAFREPVRPVDELMAAAGFERRGFSFGRAGEEWGRRWENELLRRRDDAVDAWDLDLCCINAFEIAFESYDAFVAGDEIDNPAEVAEAWMHGTVAEAFAEAAGHEPESVIAFASRVAQATTNTTRAAALVVEALARESVGDSEAAEDALRHARSADASYGVAALHLATYEIDRGKLASALMLLRHPDLPTDDDELAFIDGHRRKLERSRPNVGRNDPCPCGSGRKFKQCCQHAPAPLSARTELLSYKLARYAMDPARRSGIVGLATSALDRDNLEDSTTLLASLAQDPFILDLAVYEDGLAADYLAARGEMLPEDERALVALLIDTPRRLYEITAVSRGTSITLRDTTSGDTFVVSERLGSERAAVGQLVLLRLAPVEDTYQSFGIILDIPLRLRDSALAISDADPPATADELAAWYGAVLRPPPIVHKPGMLGDLPLYDAPDAQSFLAQVMRDQETRWLDEPVPALGGLTPRQAADDPTRREDLVALLREFDRMPAPPPGAATFNVARLRKELGLG